jgi:hypothetical protein
MAGSATRGKQRYAIYDAAGGLLQEGFVRVDDMVSRQPWLDESFDFPVEVTGGSGRGERPVAVTAGMAAPAP